MTEQEENANEQAAEALRKIAAIVDASESDPEVMWRALAKIYRITKEVLEV